MPSAIKLIIVYLDCILRNLFLFFISIGIFRTEYILTYSENGNNLNPNFFYNGFGISLIKDQVEHIGALIRFELGPPLFIIITIPN